MSKRKPNGSDGTGGLEIDLGGPISETAPIVDNAADGSTASEGFTDPASVGENGASASGEPQRRGRGRPKGSGTKQKAETVRTVGADGIAGILMGVHSMLATIARAPELELSEDEAAKIAKASVAVAKLYNIETTEKAAAWANLAGALGGAYIPRFLAINFRKSQEAAQRKASSGNVTNFPGGPPIQPGMPGGRPLN